ncbi:hypothetical protein CERSUDRAFT_110486, partial [Gelatoporia subvermispora B]
MASDEENGDIESSLEIPPYETQFISQEDDDETLWEVIEILDERPTRYKVKWAGLDTAGKPWAPSWVPKHDCTDILVRDWKIKQARKKKGTIKKTTGKTRSSATSSSRSSKQLTVTPKSGPSNPGSRQIDRPSVTRSVAHVVEDEPGRNPRSVPPRPHSGADTTDLAPPRKKKKVFVEIVQRSESRSTPHAVSPTSAHSPNTNELDLSSSGVAGKGKQRETGLKIGPPRGVKRKRNERSRGQELEADATPRSALPNGHDARAKPVNLSQEPIPRTPLRQSSHVTVISSQTRRLLRQEEEEDTQEALGLAQYQGGMTDEPGDRHLDADSGQIHLALEDTFSMEGFVPETQLGDDLLASPDNETVQDAHLGTPNLPVTPVRSAHPQPVKSGSSFISKMKRRSANNTEGETAGRHPLINQPSLGEEPKGNLSRPQKSKPLRPIPIVTPSVFRPHLPDFEPPPSSIEQFSSPENGTQRAVERVIQKTKQVVDIKGKGRAITFSRDDATLHARGQALAAEADAARFRQRERQPQSRRPLPPPKSKSHSGTQAWKPASVAEQPGGLQHELGLSRDDHLLADQLAEDYIDFNGGLGSSADQSPAPVERDMYIQAEKNRHDEMAPTEPTSDEIHNILATEESHDVMGQSAKGLPSTSSTQRADIDSQSQQYNSHIQALTDALNEKAQEILQKAEETDELRRRNAALTEDISTTTLLHETRNKALADATTRNSQLEAELAELRQALAREKTQAEVAQQEQRKAIEDVERRKADAESDRDLFRDLYGKASAHASEIGARNAQLEREMSVASTQITDGLTMVKKMYETRVQRLQGELERWKGLCKVLQDKDERTNDEIRRQAADEPKLREENAALRDAVADLQERVGSLQATIEELAGIVSEEPDTIEVEDALALQQNSDPILIPEHDDITDLAQFPSTDAGRPPSDVRSPLPGGATPDQSTSALSYLDEHSLIHTETAFYICQYVTDTTMCNARFSNAESRITPTVYIIPGRLLFSIVEVFSTVRAHQYATCSRNAIIFRVHS